MFAQGIGYGGKAHEAAPALPGFEATTFLKHAEGAAQGVPVNAEARGEVRFRGQLVPRLEARLVDEFNHCVGHPSPFHGLRCHLRRPASVKEVSSVGLNDFESVNPPSCPNGHK